MANLKWMYNAIEAIFLAIWGLNVLEIVPFLAVDFLSSLDGIIKSLMALAGLVYFIVTIPHKLKMQKHARKKEILDQKLMEEQIEELEKKNGSNDKAGDSK